MRRLSHKRNNYMIGQKNNMNQLDTVIKYEKNEEIKIQLEQRPVFHVTPTVGWANDPNGFSIYNGEYHLFYQYYPFDTKWGPMHWGHVKSKDFIKWDRLPCALAPDKDYETGCFSGSAIEIEDGRHMIVYTSHFEKEIEGIKVRKEYQSIAFGDGIKYTKFDGNPVITVDQLPKGFSQEDFRDPKIWREVDEFYLIAVCDSETNGGSVLLFNSQDRLSWKFITIFDQSNHEFGGMWECPDFFKLGDEHILIISPMNMLAKDLEFHNGHSTIYITGEYDKNVHKFSRHKVRSLEYGLDFYAPQTMFTKDNRRVMIGWMQSWKNNMTPSEFNWSGMMTIPRELELINGKLYQNPVKEIKNYYLDSVIYKDVFVENNCERKLEGVNGRVLDMTVNIKSGNFNTFTVSVAKGESYHTDIQYDNKKNVVTFDRKYSGLAEDIIENRSFYVDDLDGKITLRIILDRYSVEIFVNNGAQACTSLIYTSHDISGIFFSTDGELLMDVEKHTIQL